MSLPPDNRPTPVTAFDHALKAFLDDLFAAQPVWATQIGFHAHDDRWPDMTEAGRSARLAMLRDHAGRLGALASTDLSADEQIDRGVVAEAIEGMIFEDEQLREHAWDSLSYVWQAGSGLFGLLAREVEFAVGDQAATRAHAQQSCARQLEVGDDVFHDRAARRALGRHVGELELDQLV